MQGDWEYINKISHIFESKGGVVYFAELEAGLDERLERNKSPHRLMHKPTKRNVEWSEQELIKSMEKHRLNSYDGEITKENYIKINNTKISPEEVARIIKESFEL